MFKRVFISHVVPKGDILKYNVSAAANYFSYNLIEGNCFDTVFSLPPTNIISRIEDSGSVKYIQSRFFYSNIFFKTFNIILDNVKLFLAISKNSNVWFYNLTHQTIFVYLLLRFFKKGTKVFVILLDFTPSTNVFSFKSFIFNQIKKSNGVISLTDNKELIIKNKIILPGLVPLDEGLNKQTIINNTFLLSGILSKNRCPELIFEVFSTLPNFELIITGKIEDKSLIDKYVNNFENIKYLGFLEYEEYLSVLEGITYSINSRDPSYLENNFNFPSKSVEHLKHNKIVISTMEYSELKGINYFYVQPTFQDLIKFLKELELMDENLLLEKYANQSNKVSELFGVSNWKRSFEEIETNI